MPLFKYSAKDQQGNNISGTLEVENKNVLIYSIMRTEQREKLFKWIGPLTPLRTRIFSLKSRNDIVINNIKDAKKYKIGLVRGDARAQFFKNLGVVKTARKGGRIKDGNDFIASLYKRSNRVWKHPRNVRVVRSGFQANLAVTLGKLRERKGDLKWKIKLLRS